MRDDRDAAAAARETPRQDYLLVVTTDLRDIYDISLLLQRFGYRVCSAQSGAQAMEMAALSLPSLVITDLALSDMSGLDLLRKIAIHARSLPFIVMSPAENEHVEERRLELGGSVPVLAKPVSAEELYRAVQAAIESTPRSSLRIRTSLPVSVNSTLLDSRRGECATNLSARGLYVRMRKPYRLNDRLTVTVNIGSRAVTAAAAVLYSRRQDEGLAGEPGMAVKFTTITSEDQAFIASFIRSEVTKGLRSSRT